MRKLILSALFILGITTSWLAAQEDPGWPRQFTKDNNVLVLYQPQIVEWKDYRLLKANAAFSLTAGNGQEAHGVVSIEADTDVNKETRTANLFSMRFPSIRFPSLKPEDAQRAENLARQLLPTAASAPLSIDRLMADLEKKNMPAKRVTVKNDPPPIFYSDSPAILLIVQGKPVLAPITGTDLEFVVNANWDVIHDKKSDKYFLLSNQAWYTASELKGKWSFTDKLPPDMSKLPAGENFDDIKKCVPAPAISDSIEKIFFSSVPAELILTEGNPVYTKVDGTSLLYITNTVNDVFLDQVNKTFYVLLSGRWFSSSKLNGTWKFAGEKLPPDFAKIPEDSPKAHVLASVPGTPEAADAVMLAQIPTTVIINKKAAESQVHISYDGPPQFKKIEGTSLEYATNSPDKIIKYGDLYYLCFQAVWFMSTSPNGPWKTCDSVPDEIYTIPPSSPVYNVTYVTQTTTTSSSSVQSSTTAGYFGAFIVGFAVGECVAYGSGWYYPPYYYYPPGGYPVYQPWPCTYGGGYTYNPWTGGFAGGGAVYGPYGGAAGSAGWYNPSTGRYGHAATVQTPYGGRTVGQTYNPWTGGRTTTSQGHNAYGQWGTSVATRNGNAIQTAHVTTAAGTTAGYRTNTGQHGIVQTGANGTVVRGTNGTYAGHDGNIYRRDSAGNWSQYNNGSWQHVDANNNNANTRQQLNNEAQSRQRGEQQTQRFQQYHQSAGENANRSDFHPNFNRGNLGGFRGGGFRR